MSKPRIDETGHQYNRLTVLSYDEEKRKWKCQCECGNICYVVGVDLRRGHTKSCGCYCREQVSKASLKDLTGQQFGELIVLERDMHYYGKQVRTHWLCKCKLCNSIISVSSDALLRKGQISCGCIKSKGEYKIAKLLNEANIPFKKEFIFQDYNNRRYDFAILDEQNKPIRLIEFDGVQHYYENSQWVWTKTMNLKQRKERDIEKNNIAKEKNIDLIRIPFWKIEKLTLKQILDDTFLI